MKIDREVDLHGLTAAQARYQLDDIWSRREWHGLTRVRVVHGTGEVLWQVARQWADEKGIPWAPERANPGATILHPSQRARTGAAPPNRPLARQRRLLDLAEAAGRASPTAPATEEPPEPPAAPTPTEDPMAAEWERLAGEDPTITRRRKGAR